MGIRRWEPFTELMSMREAPDRPFEERFRPPAEWGTLTSPAVDIYQTDRDVVLRVALPGVKPEDIDISVLGDTVTIKGEVKSEENVNREDYYYQERRYGAFSRTLTLPLPVQADKAEAKAEAYDVEVMFPWEYDLSGLKATVQADGWRFAVNSGATKNSGNSRVFLFSVQPVAKPVTGPVKISLEGAKQADGTARPLAFAFQVK